MAIPLFGSVGLGVDYAQWVVWTRQLHSAADLSALAGAGAKANSQDTKTAVNRALALNQTRNFDVVSIENPPTSGSYVGNTAAVRVTLKTQQPLPFSSLYLKNPPVLQVAATAIAGHAAPNCVISLNPTVGTNGVTISGSASVTMNCGLASNSNLLANTSDLVSAAALSAAGTVTAGSAVTASTQINDLISPVGDPYASKLPLPSTGSSCSPNTWPLFKADYTLDSGCYLGLQVSGGTLTLNPGIYYIGEKGISVAAGAGITGTGVTLIFTNTSTTFNSKKIGTFSAAGSSTVSLSASTSGTYAGVLMYQDPRTPYANTTNPKITGNSTSFFQGAIYAPSVGVTFIGNSGMSTGCLQIVAYDVTFTGNTNVANNCPIGSGASAYGGSSMLRLVE